MRTPSGSQISNSFFKQPLAFLSNTKGSQQDLPQGAERETCVSTHQAQSPSELILTGTGGWPHQGVVALSYLPGSGWETWSPCRRAPKREASAICLPTSTRGPAPGGSRGDGPPTP